MEKFLPFNCVPCDCRADSASEKQQQKMALASMTAASSQKNAFDSKHNERNQPCKIDFSRKMSLKNTKSHVRKLTDFTHGSNQSGSVVESLRMVHSPQTKIVINYRPSSFAQVFSPWPMSPAVGPFVALQNRMFVESKGEVRTPELRTSILPSQQRVKQKESIEQRPVWKSPDKENLHILQTAKKTESKNQSEQPEHLPRRKVHFAQPQPIQTIQSLEQSVQNLNHNMSNLDYRQTYSAFGSATFTNLNLALKEQGSGQSEEGTGSQKMQDMGEISQIIKQKVEVRRGEKKNMTCFRAAENKFADVRTVNTIKSIAPNNEQSFVDLKFMQDRQRGFLYRLTQ